MTQTPEGGLGDAHARALEFSRLEDVKAAEEGVRRIWSENPRDSGIARLLIGVLWDAGRRSEAEELLAQQLTRDPESLDLLNVSARIFMDQRDYGASSELAEKVLAADLTNVEARIILGQSLIGRSRSAEAAVVLAPDAFAGPVPEVARRLYRLALVRKNGLLIAVGVLLAWAAAELLVASGRPVVGLAVLVLIGFPMGLTAVRIFGAKGLLRTLPWWALVAGYGAWLSIRT